MLNLSTFIFFICDTIAFFSDIMGLKFLLAIDQYSLKISSQLAKLCCLLLDYVESAYYSFVFFFMINSSCIWSDIISRRLLRVTITYSVCTTIMPNCSTCFPLLYKILTKMIIIHPFKRLKNNKKY